MGYANAAGMAEQVNDGALSLDAAVSWHLSSNCYPPVPQLMVPVAVQAIHRMRTGHGDSAVTLPHGTTYRGRVKVEASLIIESLRLDAFVECDA